MIQRRSENKKPIQNLTKLQLQAEKARAALAEKRAREAVEWKPREMPPGIPPRPANIVDYVVDYVQPNGETFKNYAQLAKALGTTRQNVFEWKNGDRIPDHFLPGIIMQTGINAAVLLLWNTANTGRPASIKENTARAKGNEQRQAKQAENRRKAIEKAELLKRKAEKALAEAHLAMDRAQRLQEHAMQAEKDALRLNDRECGTSTSREKASQVQSELFPSPSDSQGCK